MTRTRDVSPRPAAYRALAAAIRARDRDAIFKLVAQRCTTLMATGCQIWGGGITEYGYPYVLRAPSVYVHRVVAWAAAGFPGELAGFPPVHHQCAHTRCVNSAHLVPATSLLNAVEAQVRKTLVTRIHSLGTEILRLDPGNRLVRDWPTIEGGVPEEQLRAWRRNLSMGESLRQQKKREQYVAKQRERRQMRFDQVLKVRRLQASGMSVTDAIKVVGIARSTFDDWNRRYQQDDDSDPQSFVTRRV